MTRRELFEAAGAAALPEVAAQAARVDFRYAPRHWQSTICFPDDPHKSLVDEAGRLLYGNPGTAKGVPGGGDYFPVVVDFTVTGMESAPRRQTMEAPEIPIVRTVAEQAGARLELAAFASDRPGEGRVDNVIVRAPAGATVSVLVTARGKMSMERGVALLDGKPFLVSSRPLRLRDQGSRYRLQAAAGEGGEPLVLRFPRSGQTVSLAAAEELLDEARAWWRAAPLHGLGVEWTLPAPYGEFLSACARNILQSRERRDGRLTFQVGPTCYRGLWVVDGHFLLESARYLGFDKEALDGLATTWTYQRGDGALDAGGGPEHYKDAAIAMFSTVRQCELSGDWAPLVENLERIRHAAAFLDSRRDKTRFGLIVPGFADGGFSKGYEFTNTLWTLAGLGAVAARPEGAFLAPLLGELRAGFEAAAKSEMVRHPAGFDYLPMVMRDDAVWRLPPRQRPNPQTAQWALAQAIYPGVVFAPAHPVVRGHLRLMQWATKEDVPVETGWIWHDGLWTYGAAFAAHAYLWSGERAWASRTFHGFLNHASPLRAWREEQPLRGALSVEYVGDMPHNWASAECILYLRQMLALEDGPGLRLLDGLGPAELAAGGPFALQGTPTRFGRLNLSLSREGESWRLACRRDQGPKPAFLRLPASLGGLKFQVAKGAAAKVGARAVEIDPAASEWSARWGA